MNYAKATTEQELLDMVAYLESKGYDLDDYCCDNITDARYQMPRFCYVGLMERNGLVNNAEYFTLLQGHEVSVSEFLKQ